MGLFNDLKFGLRMMLKTPGFTLVAIVTLALGIGVNSTVFTIVNAVLINGLPFHDPREILYIRTNLGVSYLDYLDFKQQTRSVKDVAAFGPLSPDLSDQ